MDAAAKVTANGQLVVPAPVRKALHLEKGERVLFRVYEGWAVLARTTELLEGQPAADVVRQEALVQESQGQRKQSKVVIVTQPSASSSSAILVEPGQSQRRAREGLSRLRGRPGSRRRRKSGP